MAQITRQAIGTTPAHSPGARQHEWPPTPMPMAALWRGYKTLSVSSSQLSNVRVPSIVLIGSEDISAAGVPELNKTQPQIRTVVVPGAQHGGPEGVMRRAEFMAALRPFLAAAR